MADVKNIKTGASEPDSILFGALTKALKFRFSGWVLNTEAGHEVEVTADKVIIRKFKPNVWIMHSEKVTGSQNHAICDYCHGTIMTSRGMAAHADLFGVEQPIDNNHGAGNDKPKFRGFCPYPMNAYMEWMQMAMYTWEGCWSAPDVRDQPNVADWAAFRLGSGGHGTYGIWTDFDNKLMFPDKLYDFNSWGRNPAKNADWYYGFMLASGLVQNFDDGSWSCKNSAVRNGRVITVTQRLADGATGYHAVRWNTLRPCKLKVEGLQSGDRLEYGYSNAAVASSDKSITADGTYAIASFGNGSNGAAFKLYGNTSATSAVNIELVNDEYPDGIVDISDSPIEITLESNVPHDIGDIECWDAYVGNEQVYHKDKTAENYWEKYGMTYPGKPLEGVTPTSVAEYNVGDPSRTSKSYNLQPVTDFDAFMAAHETNESYVSWKNCRPANLDFWEPVKEYYRTVGISHNGRRANDFYQGNGIFANTTIDELEVTFNTDLSIDLEHENSLNLYAHNLIGGSAVRKLTIRCKEGQRVSSLHGLCNGAWSLEELAWEGTPPIAHDLSHLFEGAPNIKKIPDCIRWDERLGGNKTNLTTSFYNCGKLPRIDCEKGMVCLTDWMPHTFDGCSSLTYLEPIFDVHLIDPMTYAGYDTWWGCTKLTHLKVKGIHGVWRMDNSNHPARSDTWPANNPHTNGNLPSLDAECVAYLFDNALTAEEGETCELYCPSEWADKITPDMLSAIKAKGWKAYVGGVEN